MSRVDESAEAAARRALVLSAEGITVRVQSRRLFGGLTWRIRRGEHWAVLGPNGSGKSSLLRALAGLAPTSAGHVRHHLVGGVDAVAYLSFEEQEALLRREQEVAAFRLFAGDLSGGATGRDVLLAGSPPGSTARLAAELDLEPILGRELGVLSTGEARRILVARALAGGPGLLLLDEPYDGLDSASRERLRQLLRALGRDGVSTVTATHRVEELLPETTHVLLLRDGRAVAQGEREAVLAAPAFLDLYRTAPAPAPPVVPPARLPAEREPLVAMRGVTVRWGDVVVLDGLDWTVRAGENWAILGPNGAGKTTILELVYGDNQQAYANDVSLFGRRRGTGESLWEIRARMGIVSPALQTRFRTRDTVAEVVASGYHDSVGLYRRPTEEEVAGAEEWIGRLGLAPIAERLYAGLSSGERRMALVARAMVKGPELLILDEPCAGLDPANRALVLGLLDRIGSGGATSLLYVSHVEDEIPACVSRVLHLPGRGRAAVELRR